MSADRTTQNTLIALVLGLLLYLASPPLVIWAVERTHSVYLMGQAFEIFYKPAGWLYDNCPPYHWYISTTLRMVEGRP